MASPSYEGTPFGYLSLKPAFAPFLLTLQSWTGTGQEWSMTRASRPTPDAIYCRVMESETSLMLERSVRRSS